MIAAGGAGARAAREVEVSADESCRRANRARKTRAREGARA